MSQTNSAGLSLTLATRGSRLALKQARYVADLLTKNRGIFVTIRTIKTTGDKDARAFSAIGGKGLFTAEIERAVVEKEAHIAVHSAKDLTAELAPGCTIVCIPQRVDVRDVVVGSSGDSGEERLASLPPGAVVGTSSMRRRALLAEARSDVEVVDFRGNLDTRLRKVADGTAGAAILAAAGIERLGLPVDRGPLDPDRWVPAPAQGALAVEALIEREDIGELFDGLNDRAAWDEVVAERAFAERLEGGCSVPLGCRARVDGQNLVVTGFLGSPSGGDSLRDRVSGPRTTAVDLGNELAEAILTAGGDDILEEVRATGAPEWSEP